MYVVFYWKRSKIRKCYSIHTDAAFDIEFYKRVFFFFFFCILLSIIKTEGVETLLEIVNHILLATEMVRIVMNAIQFDSLQQWELPGIQAIQAIYYEQNVCVRDEKTKSPLNDSKGFVCVKMVFNENIFALLGKCHPRTRIYYIESRIRIWRDPNAIPLPIEWRTHKHTHNDVQIVQAESTTHIILSNVNIS